MTTRRAAARRLLQWAVLPITLSHCSSVLAPVQDAPDLATIDELPTDIPRAVATHGVLLVHPPTCRPLYDTARMAYSLRPHHLDFYARHEWAERPARMLQPLLLRTLEATQCCALAAPSPPARYDWSLRTELRKLVQDFGDAPPRFRVALRLVLQARGQLPVVHDIEVAQVMARPNAEAGVAAANVAMAAALRATAQRVLDVLGG